jgi:hypothetical protein
MVHRDERQPPPLRAGVRRRRRPSLLSLGVLAVGLPVILLFREAAFARERSQVDLWIGVGALSPSELKDAGASAIEAATGAGGNGITFEIVQRSALHARPDGPLIEIPDPIDPSKSLGLAETYALGSLIERGAITPDGFWMEMRAGPAEGQDPDWKAAYQLGAIATGGKTWRNDGDGWYLTDRPPGIGLDPRTAALLPALLRNATEAADAGTEEVDGRMARNVTASARVEDIPGIVAVDGEAFTSLVGPLEFAFDDAGRLVQLRAIARNENEETFDLLVETVITFAYPASKPAIPEPAPTWSPPPAPISEP